MENKAIPLSIYLGVIVVMILLAPSLPELDYSRGQIISPIVSTSPSFLYLGYGPSLLSPADDGSPIFTVNDSLWIYSSLDQTISVTLRNPFTNTSIGYALSPSTSTSLYTFTGTDQLGTWILTATLQNSTSYTIGIPLASSSQNQASAGLNEYSIQNGEINLGFSVDAPNSYDMEGCLASTFGNGTLYLSEPTNIGSGQISIAINAGNGTATVSATGSTSAVFSFWFDLEYSYGYAASIENETISRNLPVSRSDTVLFNSTSTESVSIPILNSLRVGRYVIRGFFDSSSGFETSATRALLLSGGQWFWLSSCNPFAITGSTFSKQVSLAQSPSLWPSLLLFMYQSEGIEGYSVVPLQINLARLDFIGQPGNVQLNDFTYTIANNSDIEASGTFSGSVYIIAKSYPIDLTITPSIGSETLTSLQINISRPLTDSQYYIPIGKLTVIVLNNSRPDVGVLVGISNSEGVSLESSLSLSGNTSFYLPSGFYNITVSKGTLANSGNATVLTGSNTIVQFSLTSSGIPIFYLELLVVPLIIGLGLNVWAWIVRPRGSKYRLK